MQPVHGTRNARRDHGPRREREGDPRDRVKRHIKTTQVLHYAPVYNASVDGEVAWVKVAFVHGALVFDGAWWWHRMSEPLAGLGLGTMALEIPSCVAPPAAPAESLIPSGWRWCLPRPPDRPDDRSCPVVCARKLVSHGTCNIAQAEKLIACKRVQFLCKLL